MVALAKSVYRVDNVLLYQLRSLAVGGKLTPAFYAFSAALSRFFFADVDTYGHCRGDRGWLSHGLVVTLPISYSLDGGTLWGFTRDMRITD